MQNLRKKYLFLIAICAFFLIFFATKSSWNGSSDILIFENGNNNIYFGQFFRPQQAFKMNFNDGFSEKGNVVLKRDHKDIQPFTKLNDYSFFHLLNGDSLCTGDLCKAVKEDGFLVKKQGINGWWSTRFARVNGFDAPINRTFSMQSENVTELLFVKANFRNDETHILKQGTNHLKLNKIKHYQTFRVIYAAAFAFLCTMIVCFFYRHWQNIMKIFYKVPVYSISLAIILIIEYIIVFPGIFSTDTVAPELSAGYFNIWYSSAYMGFSRLIACLYPDLIQLPGIIIFYVASVYLTSLLKTVNYGKTAIAFLFLLQIIMPTFFVAIFVQQRIFLAIILLYAAIIFACGNIFERKNIKPITYVFLIFSSLLRPEYWLIFFIFLLHDAWKRKVITASSLKPTFFTLISAICCYLFITYPFIWIQGASNHTFKSNYQLVSLLDMVKPYVNCSDKNDPLSQAIEKLGNNATGGLQEYCSTTPENFFWSSHTRDENTIIKANATLKNELFNYMKKDPKPSIKRIFINIEEMSVQAYWQLYDRYSNQTQEITLFHIQKAERFGFMRNYLWQFKIHTFVTHMFLQISSFLNVLVSLIFMIFVVPIISRCWLTIVINSAFLFMTVFVGFAAPVAQWYYLVFIPIWSVLAFPFDMLLWASKKDKTLEMK